MNNRAQWDIFQSMVLPTSGVAVSPDTTVCPTVNPSGAIMYLFSRQQNVAGYTG